MFCNTSECDADRGFLRTDDDQAHSLVTIAVQRRAVDPSIVHRFGTVKFTDKSATIMEFLFNVIVPGWFSTFHGIACL